MQQISLSTSRETQSQTKTLTNCFLVSDEILVYKADMNNNEFPSVKTGVRNLTRKVGKKALTWTIIYFWGYFGLGLGWLSVPLMLSILR